VASPLLANLYINRLLKGWRNTKRGEQFQAHVISYADDFVILSRGKAVQALDWTRRVVTRLGLTLNEAKTSIKQARKDSFDFLGYTFGPHCFQPDGRWYLGASPSKKSVARIKQKVGDLLMPNNVEVWPEVRDRLNQILRGWCAYFSYGTTAQAYQAGDYYVYESVRHYLRRRHQVRSRGTNSCFSRNAVYGRLGVVPLRRVRMGSRS
jgi:RNA-directed DNA polymerase